MRYRGKIVLKNFWGEKILFIMTLLGMTIGLVNVVMDNAEIWPYLRDIIHISSIMLICFYFKNMVQKYLSNIRVLYNTVFFFCGTYSLIVNILAMPKYMRAGSFYEFVFPLQELVKAYWQ